MAIERLPDAGEWPELVAKINELVDWVNALDKHYHIDLLTQGNTSSPRYDEKPNGD